MCGYENAGTLADFVVLPTTQSGQLVRPFGRKFVAGQYFLQKQVTSALCTRGHSTVNSSLLSFRDKLSDRAPGMGLGSEEIGRE